MANGFVNAQKEKKLFSCFALKAAGKLGEVLISFFSRLGPGEM